MSEMGPLPTTRHTSASPALVGGPTVGAVGAVGARVVAFGVGDRVVGFAVCSAVGRVVGERCEGLLVIGSVGLDVGEVVLLLRGRAVGRVGAAIVVLVVVVRSVSAEMNASATTASASAVRAGGAIVEARPLGAFAGERRTV